MKVTANLFYGPVAASAVINQATIEAEAQFSIDIRPRQTIEDYTGDYEITSFCAEPLLTTSLILPTFDKHMLDNVTVYSIPTKEEYNAAGGVTFIIGGYNGG